MNLIQHRLPPLDKAWRDRLRTAPQSPREIARLALRWMLRMTPILVAAAIYPAATL
jgi:hypothetical protein